MEEIGTDLDNAIFNGFSILAKKLEKLLCVFHLKRADKKKLSELSKKSVVGRNVTKSIINDIYGKKYGSIHEYGLADSRNKDEFNTKLSAIASKWEAICPEFHKWFMKKRTEIFEDCVIESARESNGIDGLYYNNDVECMDFKEKLEQCFKMESLFSVLSHFKTLIDRQYNQ